ncbi:MAG: DNA translocase FtsK [Clostridiales bacterium]|nr:DNA translocase FtsK [Clostridiales bacterium]
MLSSVTGFGTLMQYIRNVNLNILRVAEPDSCGEYLARSYQRFNNQLNPLPGGGAMGMLLAFPVWKILGQVGGVIFLIIAMISLLFAFLRINPVRLYQRFESFLQGGSRRGKTADEQGAVAAVDAAGSKAADLAAASNAELAGTMSFQPQAEPYYVEPWQDNQKPDARDLYTQAPVFVTPAAFVPNTFPQKPEDEGFTAVENDYYEKFEREPKTNKIPPVKPPVPQATANIGTPSLLQEVIPPVTEETPVSYMPVISGTEQIKTKPKVEEPAASQSQRLENTRSLDVRPLQTESIPPEIKEQEPDKSVLSRELPRRQVSSSRINEVGTAPAVELTGERITIQPSTSLPAKASRIDGTAKVKPQVKQMSLDIDHYQRPSTGLISSPPPDPQADTSEEDNKKADKLISTLASFNISATVKQVVHGPAVTSFGIRLAEGVNINKLRNVMDNISVELLAKSPARAEIPIPGTPLIGIEVSNEKDTIVYLREILDSPKMQALKSPSAVALGKDIYGAPVICELMDMPHLLIAGATGSGKSVCINSIITSLIYRSTPKEVRMILIDPKFVELQPYNDVPHLLLPVVVDPKKAVMALEWVCQEMDDRYKTLEKYRARNIDAYNAKLEADEDPMPKIIVIVDEMADLMLTAGKAIDEHIKRITAKARAAGICLIMATQRPSVDVITGIIKANIPSRIAFQVSSQVDSRTILDSQGAEMLLGYGDMLYFPRTLKAPKRVQGCFISDKDVGAVVDFVKRSNQTEYNLDIMEHIEKEEKKGSSGGGSSDDGSDGSIEGFDELLPKAIEMAVEAGQMSISMLQRVLRVGYGRAGRLIDEMCRRSIISGNEGTKPRKTLISREEYQQLVEEDKPF